MRAMVHTYRAFVAQARAEILHNKTLPHDVDPDVDILDKVRVFVCVCLCVCVCVCVCVSE